MRQHDLTNILRAHLLWLHRRNSCYAKYADLHGADLRDASMYFAKLYGANINGANINGAKGFDFGRADETDI